MVRVVAYLEHLQLAVQLLAAATPRRRRAECCAHAIRAGGARTKPLDSAGPQLGGAAHESNLAEELEQLALVGV